MSAWLLNESIMSPHSSANSGMAAPLQIAAIVPTVINA